VTAWSDKRFRHWTRADRVWLERLPVRRVVVGCNDGIEATVGVDGVLPVDSDGALRHLQHLCPAAGFRRKGLQPLRRRPIATL